MRVHDHACILAYAYVPAFTRMRFALHNDRAGYHGKPRARGDTPNSRCRQYAPMARPLPVRSVHYFSVVSVENGVFRLF